ncbi:MAG: hydroxymethylglutaryl-CoA reductase, degradative [Deltaproteobacteria bacterium]
MTDSRLPGFYKWPVEKRRSVLAELLGRPVDDFGALDPDALALALADKLIENVVGVLSLPLGIGLNLKVNGADYLVPMAVEEPSVVAAFSNAAKMARAGGGFTATCDPSHMIGQLQLCPPDDTTARSAEEALRAGIDRVEAAAADASRPMAARGGGLVRTEIRRLTDPDGGPPMVILHVVIDVVDAMGANVVNHVCESTAPVVTELTGLPVNLRILSNLAAHRLARAQTRIPVEAVGGREVAERIAEADRFARLDPFRAATHNKGLLNGIDAVAIATGNDWRSIEAGAHAWAARDGQYRGLTRWTLEGEHLAGSIELPLAVGTVGGITRSHPSIQLLRELMGVSSARTLSGIFASVGLAQNLAALRALAAEGIQRGHMALHARQLALAAGAAPDEVDRVVERTLEGGPVSAERVAHELTKCRGES